MGGESPPYQRVTDRYPLNFHEFFTINEIIRKAVRG